VQGFCLLGEEAEMSVFKRGGIYWYEFVFKGQRVRESTRLTNKTAAINAEAAKRAELIQGRVTPKQSPLFSQFVKEEFLPWSVSQHQKHNTHKRYRVSSKPLMSFFGKSRLDHIATADIEQFKIKRLKECSAAGVNRDLAALRFMLNFALRHGYVHSNPFKGIKLLQEGPGIMRIVSHEEEVLYLSNAPPLLRDIAILILQTGMRPEEVFSIRGENVDLKKKFIFIPNGKTKFARRTIPLTGQAFEVLQRRSKKGYLFPHKDNPDKPMVCLRSHKTLAKKLKMDFRLYDLRHTFGSRSAMAGVDLPTLKELMGHSSIVLTMRYIHPTPEHKIQALEKLEKLNNTHKSPHSGTMDTP
jgi:integrase